jgi:hypothetical protein
MLRAEGVEKRFDLELAGGVWKGRLIDAPVSSVIGTG